MKKGFLWPEEDALLSWACEGAEEVTKVRPALEKKFPPAIVDRILRNVELREVIYL